MSEALNIAREIASKSGVATRLAKHALNQIEELSLRDGYRFEQTMTGQLLASEDHKEAILAFQREARAGIRAPVVDIIWRGASGLIQLAADHRDRERRLSRAELCIRELALRGP